MFNSNTTQDTILRAAMQRFAGYGYKRTSLGDIADEAGVSRPTLYTYFKNKAAILEAVSLGLHDSTLLRVEAALTSDQELRAQLVDAFLAWSEPFMDILFGSAHGAELISANGTVAGEISAQARARFHRLLLNRLNLAKRNSEIDLTPIGLTGSQAAEFLLLALNGLSNAVSNSMSKKRANERTHRKRLQTLADLFLTSVRAKSN